MSNVPAAVRAQVNEANRMVEAIKNGQNPMSPAPAAGDVPANIPNVGAQIPADARPVDLTQRAAPSISLQPPATQFQVQPTQVRQPAPAQQPASVQPPADATAMQPPDPDHKYKVLRGKYDAEQRRSQNAIAELQRQNAVLIDRLGAPAPPPAAPVQPATLEQRAAAVGISKAEIAEYGPDLIEMMIRTASNIASQRVAPLETSQRQLTGAVTQTVESMQRTAREMVYDSLADNIPNWQNVNMSEEFLDWLKQLDLFSGQTRNAGLLRAFEANDATRVVSIFKAFLEEDERSRSTARIPSVDPATLVAPGQPLGASPAPMGGNQSGRIWLESEVGEFNSLVRRGVFRHNPAEKLRIEGEINQAIAEGRVKPTHNDAGLANAR